MPSVFDEFGHLIGIAEGATFNKSLWLAVGAADGREGRGTQSAR